MAIEKNFLQLEFGSGQFFDYSKDEKEGYVKHTSTKGNISYRKYEKDGVSGILESASIYEGKFGNQISLNIKNGDNVYYVPVDIADQKGNVDTYAESLIKVLPKLNKGDQVLVRGYNFTPEGDKYSKIGISVTANGEKLKGLTNTYVDKEGKAVDGDIPGITWKKDALGKNKPTAITLEAKNDYLLEVLKVQTDRLKWVQGETSQPAAPVPVTKTPTQAFEPAVSAKKEEMDSLPF